MAKTGTPSTSTLDRAALRRLARLRLADARALFRARRYDGATYLCGYVIEYALKARICRTLRWVEYRTGEKYRSFKVHDVEALLGLSGVEDMVLRTHATDWNFAKQWSPELRYDPNTKATSVSAKAMLTAATNLLRVLA
jgi:hypothetical protein